MALAVGLRTDQQRQRTLVVELKGGFLAAREGAGLDIGTDADAAVLAVLRAVVLPGLEAVPVGNFQCLLQMAGKITGCRTFAPSGSCKAAAPA